MFRSVFANFIIYHKVNRVRFLAVCLFQAFFRCRLQQAGLVLQLHVWFNHLLRVAGLEWTPLCGRLGSGLLFERLYRNVLSSFSLYSFFSANSLCSSTASRWWSRWCFFFFGFSWMAFLDFTVDVTSYSLDCELCHVLMGRGMFVEQGRP